MNETQSATPNTSPAPDGDPEAHAAALVEGQQAPTPEEPEDDESSLKPLFIGVGVVIGVVVVTTLIFIILALASPNAAETLGAIRDIFIIVLAWFSVFICISIVVLVLQVAALFNLIKNEMVPILESFQKTTNTVRGTSTFVSKNLTQPVIRATGFFAYVRTFFEYLHVIRSAELKEDFVTAPAAKDTATEENKS